MKRILISAFLVFILFSGKNLDAQVFLEKGKVVHDIEGGDRVSSSIMIHNTSNKDVNLSVYLEDFVYEPPYDGTKKFLPAGTTENSLQQWLSFSPQSLSLGPFEKREVFYVIQSPLEFNEGHYGVLFIEKNPDEAQGQKGLNIVTRVGCLFFVDPIGKRKKLAVKEFEIKENRLVGRFDNQSSMILIPSMIYYVMDPTGLVISRGDIAKKYLSSEAQSNFEIPLDGFSEGKFTVVMTIDLDGGDVIVREVDLNIGASLQASITDIRQ